jgi:hypothetical protein
LLGEKIRTAMSAENETEEPGVEQPAEPDPLAGGGQPGPPGGPGEPTEEELRERLEEEVKGLRVQDVLLQSVVSIINLSARRIGKEDEQDLEQARLGIDAARAVVDLLDPEPGAQVRNAISEIQVMYAAAADGSSPPAEPSVPGGAPPAAEPTPTPGAPPPAQAPAPPSGGPGERKPPPGLWTPPGV